MAKYKLGDIAPIQQGSVPESESYWLLNLDMVESNTGHIYERLYVPFDKIGTSTIAFDTNNVLYSKLRPYLNKVVIPDCPGYATSEMLPLKPNKNYITREYLTYFLRSPKFVAYINEKTSGAKMPRANSSDLKSVEIECPTLENQRHITSEFDRIISIVRLRQQQLQKLDELVKARFVELFGDLESNPFDWPVCALKELVSIEPQNGLYKPQSAYVQDGSGFPIVRIDAFYNGRVTDFSALKRLECSESEVQRYLLQEDDIVINRVNSIEYLGKCAHIKGLLEETVFESNMMRLHLDDTVMNAVFATKLLCSQYMHKQIMIRAKKAVNQASINQQDVLSFRMFVPPLELQEQFAAFVEQTDKSKVAVQKALDEAQLLFDSLMQKYFG